MLAAERPKSVEVSLRRRSTARSPTLTATRRAAPGRQQFVRDGAPGAPMCRDSAPRLLPSRSPGVAEVGSDQSPAVLQTASDRGRHKGSGDRSWVHVLSRARCSKDQLSADFLPLTWLSPVFLPESYGETTPDSVADHSRIGVLRRRGQRRHDLARCQGWPSPPPGAWPVHGRPAIRPVELIARNRGRSLPAWCRTR